MCVKLFLTPTQLRCNFAHLVEHAAQHQCCPVFGCEAQLSRKRSVVRDENLRAALAAVAPTPQHQCVWVRGDEIQLTPPDDAYRTQLRAVNGDADEQEGDGSQQPSTSKELRVGDSVEGQYGTDVAEKWWPGTITRVWTSGSVDVCYDDGDVEVQKLRSRVRRLQADVSMRAAKRTVKDAVAQARAEGLQLERSTCASSGYTGVKAASYSSRYEATARRGVNGRVYLGNFATAEEAALAVARAEARTEARAEATEDKQHEDELTVDCEQLQPVTWAQCETCDKWRKLPHLAEDQVPDEWYCHMNLDPLHNACDLPEEPEDDDVSMHRKPCGRPPNGTYGLPMRWSGPKEAGRWIEPLAEPEEEQEARVVRLSLRVGEGGGVRAELLRPDAACPAKEAVAQARAEGLQLERSTSASGYKGVKAAKRGLHEARARGVDGRVHLGSFVTAEQAALAIARAEARTEARAEKPAEDDVSVRKKPCGWPPIGTNGLPMRWSGPKEAGRWVEPRSEEPEQEPAQRPAAKIRAPSRRAAVPNRVSHLYSPCMHCGALLHCSRKECTCGRPNRWRVHAGRVVRLSLSVGEGGSVRAAMVRVSSGAPHSVANSTEPVEREVRLSLRVVEGGTVRAELNSNTSEQKTQTAEGPVLRKRKDVSQTEPIAADNADAKRKRSSSAASSSALADAHEEDDDTEFNSSELKKEAPLWHDACTWVQCDRCQKWRRLHSNDELPGEWWCQLNKDVRNGPRTSITQVLVGAYRDTHTTKVSRCI